MRFVRLPDELRRSIEREAEDVATSDLIRAARLLSDRYRSGGETALPTHAGRLSYLLTRFPATFGALNMCLESLSFQPESLLDLGAGPGTALFALADLGRPPQRCTLVEQDPGWPPLAARLELPEAAWRDWDLRRLPAQFPHDLVVCSYALNEFGEGERRALVERAWQAAAKALLLVEPGTPSGFGNILNARNWLINQGAFIAAPCPHASPCPLDGEDWCHFAVRVERSRIHRLAKGGELGYEDEKFSYVLAMRTAQPESAARILRHPAIHPGRIDLTLCTAAGQVEHRPVTKRDKPSWRRARKASWGDLWGSGAAALESDRGDDE